MSEHRETTPAESKLSSLLDPVTNIQLEPAESTALIQSLKRVDGFYYLASPYTDPDEEVRNRRFNESSAAQAKLMASGLIIYAPIAATHPLAVRYSLAFDADFWWRSNVAFMEASVGMILLQAPGWKLSRGCNLEVGYALGRKLPLFYMNPVTQELSKEPFLLQ